MGRRAGADQGQPDALRDGAVGMSKLEFLKFTESGDAAEMLKENILKNLRLLKPSDSEIILLDFDGPGFIAKLLNKAKKLTAPKPCGVYILFKNREVVYVGQTKTALYSRPFQHEDPKDWTSKKDFDSVVVLHCSEQILSPLESALVGIFKPFYNGGTNKTADKKTNWAVRDKHSLENPASSLLKIACLFENRVGET